MSDIKKKKPSVISDVRYACAVGATNTVVAIKGAVPIANCSPGCQLKTTAMLTFENGFQGSIAAGGGNMPSANSTENDVVFGGIKTLDELIKSTLKIYEGDLFVVLTGCVGELIGDNVPDLVSNYQRAGYPIVYANTAGFKGNNLYGHEVVVDAIIDQFVGDYQGEKKKGLINLWFETPYYNHNWRGDYQELARILRGAGFEVNVLFGAENPGVEAWKRIPQAQFNLVVSPWVGIKNAEHLQKKYNQPYLHIPEIPVGEEATAKFIRQVVEYAGIDKAQSEQFIRQEADIYYYYLEHFSEFFAEYWYGMPSEFVVTADAAYALAYSKFLADQIGLIPKKVIITDNTPEKYRPAITEYFKNNISEGVSIDVEFEEDGYLVEKKIESVEFTSGKPLILGSSWELTLADKKGALFFEVATPSSETLVINRSHIGYRGALQFLERIYSASVGGR
ncbi:MULTISPECIES: nitrogenase component 1 [Segatella]|jgi:nitrogenase molybdenum-iron protein beta chain|uniref:Hydrogenase n=1 Tax=Segatella bryantii TaxID=77095 RepID=A0AA37HXE8_SEGBR|nr:MULTISPECIES: nitrogenase component 1 [Segatella]MBQ3857652.1 hydrogenase [Prevotella sp.]UKK79766.1 hydrogenase [Segatella baroniae B14]GJG28715.1 hydrogenase [Segatella bryantii]SEQ99624.1 nitrogenase molybdenum-iron protein beta chain [Segatella baroniae B14]